MLHWMKWTMIAAAGCLPALALADEPAKQDDAPQELRVRVQPLKDGQPSVLVLPERGEKHSFHFGPVEFERRNVLFFDGDDAPNPQPPEQIQQLQNAQRALELAFRPAKREKGTYLGISAAPPPPVLRKQLGLAPGMGLVIEFVVPSSPAAKAGAQQFDILQKLDDQVIVNREQLTVLVRSRKPGDEIKLGVIRDGKPTTLTARLIEHDVEPLVTEDVDFQLDHVLPEPRVWQIDPRQRPPAKGWDAAVGPGNVGLFSITLLEGDRSYAIITNQAGDKTFTVKGKDGKVIFEGPIDTKEQLGKVPAELKKKLEKLQPAAAGGALNNPFGAPKAKPATEPAHRSKDAD
jgi:hypothetical protein